MLIQRHAHRRGLRRSPSKFEDSRFTLTDLQKSTWTSPASSPLPLLQKIRRQVRFLTSAPARMERGMI